MNFHTALMGTLFCSTLAACSSGDTKTDGGTTGGCDTDYAAIAKGAPAISLKNDVMPVFGLSCASASECHSSMDRAPKAGLMLGVKCDFDRATSKCVFPDAEMPDAGAFDPVKISHPLTPTLLQQVHDSLLAMSKTNPQLARVAPGDPDKSFLVDKITDQENKKGYNAQCTNQDTTKSTDPCGTYMALTSTALCLDSPDRYKIIVQWIAQGALNN